MNSTKTFEVSSRLKNKKLNIENELVENYEKLAGTFEQNHFSPTAKTIYRIGPDGIRLRNWVAYFDVQYEKIKFFVLMQVLCLLLKECSYP